MSPRERADSRTTLYMTGNHAIANRRQISLREAILPVLVTCVPSCYYIMEEGYKAGHGYYYIYVFKNEESNGSLSVGLSHRQDLHLLLMEGGLRQQIQEYYSVSIFPGISLLEAKKEWNGTFLARKRTHGSFRSLLASKRTNSSFRSHHINRSQWSNILSRVLLILCSRT